MKISLNIELALFVFLTSVTGCKVNVENLTPKPEVSPVPTTSPSPTPAPVACHQAAEELHIVSIYEASPIRSFGVHPSSDFVIKIENDTPVTLFLSSYEPIHWIIQGGENVQRVILNGYYAQSAEGVPQSLVEEHSYERTGSYAVPIAYKDGTDMKKLIAKAEEISGLKVSSLAKGYRLQSALIKPGCKLQR